MDGDDLVTLVLALFAAALAFYIVGTGHIRGSPMFLIAAAVFGAIVFARAYFRSAY